MRISSPSCSARRTRSSRGTSSTTTSAPPCSAPSRGWPPPRRVSAARSSAPHSSVAWRPKPAAPAQGSAVARSDEIHAFLKDVRLFKDVASPELGILAQSLRERPLKKNQVLFREGDAGDEMFLVRRGSIVISKGVTGRVEQV